MYSIYCADVNVITGTLGEWRVLHHPNLQDQGVWCISPTVSEALNSAGSLTFSIAPNNPLCRELKQRNTYISVRKDATEVWRGRVINITRGMNMTRTVTCEGELAYLMDTVQPPRNFHGTIATLFTSAISQHNTQATQEREFKVGTITVGIDDSLGVVEYDVNTNASTTWDLIQKTLINGFGGYIIQRKESDGIYLDYLKDIAAFSTQKISFGKNLLDFTEAIDASDVITGLMPFGATTNKPPVLYKQKGSSGVNARTFEQHTGDAAEGLYLIVANGCAMHTQMHMSYSGLYMKFSVLNPDTATITADANGHKTIVLANNPNGNAVRRWRLQQATSPTKSVSVSGSSSPSGQIMYGQSIIDVTNGTVGGDAYGSISGSVSASGKVESTQNDSWLIKCMPADQPSGMQNTIWLTAAGDKAISPATGYNSSMLGYFWTISNSENGATIKNKAASENNDSDTLHCDINGNGFSIYASANGDGQDNGDSSRVTLIPLGYSSNRIVYDGAASIWGYIYGTHIFDNVDTPFGLQHAALNYIYANSVQKLTSLTVGAVDLSMFDNSIGEITLGTLCEVVSEPHELKYNMICVQKSTCLTAPDKSKITFGAGKKTMTDLQGRLIVNAN